MSTKITIEDQYCIYSVENKGNDMCFKEFFELVVHPCLVSLYSEKVVDEHLGRDSCK